MALAATTSTKSRDVSREGNIQQVTIRAEAGVPPLSLAARLGERAQRNIYA
jgi:hypothetical protein